MGPEHNGISHVSTDTPHRSNKAMPGSLFSSMPADGPHDRDISAELPRSGIGSSDKVLTDSTAPPTDSADALPSLSLGDGPVLDWIRSAPLAFIEQHIRTFPSNDFAALRGDTSRASSF